MLVDNNLDAGPVVPVDFLPKKTRVVLKDWALLRERANDQQRFKTNKNHEDKKNVRQSRSLCQLQLDQVLERISIMHLPDERAPLEHLYALHIPNCDKSGSFNPKQCKMSLNGQRGECWCVNPSTGKSIPGSPTVRGDPECHLYNTTPEEERRSHAVRAP
ncbi:insulin-like growth factor-binding 2 [Pelobates cultripes]|uniref:Insulin-like growth factor-binding 2 n=1 Tax=Pelobates cultripes TaxID=61616 RepID=A0AAD1SL96_PELCU|nr:insulin-like growth factor-binding 2 [Pelobates cultripes]